MIEFGIRMLFPSRVTRIVALVLSDMTTPACPATWM